jgi:hypothetical protein
MLGAALALVLLSAADPSITPAPWAACPAGSLGEKATALLLPVLTERVAADQDAEARGESLDDSPHFQKFEKLLYALIDNPSADADAALAALLHVYVGEAPSGDMQCDIIHRGQRMLPYLTKFQACMPGVKGVSVPPRLVNQLPNLYPELIIAITNKEPCEPYSDERPNTRVQRTRSSASPPRSPLTRHPLGSPV